MSLYEHIHCLSVDGAFQDSVFYFKYSLFLLAPFFIRSYSCLRCPGASTVDERLSRPPEDPPTGPCVLRTRSELIFPIYSSSAHRLRLHLSRFHLNTGCSRLSGVSVSHFETAQSSRLSPSQSKRRARRFRAGQASRNGRIMNSNPLPVWLRPFPVEIASAASLGKRKRLHIRRSSSTAQLMNRALNPYLTSVFSRDFPFRRTSSFPEKISYQLFF